MKFRPRILSHPLQPDAEPLPGYQFTDADKLMGDAEDAAVTWKGSSDLTAAGDSFAIRIRMFEAKLFSYRV